ncbi:MAG: hypothetical protein HYX94_14375 [Chloroflexi bacterium]|nr:hypothetical protein [Chloroflexota bacterium]
MERMETRIPGFPLVPFLFPIGLMMALLGALVWLAYSIRQELGTLRREM